MQHGAGAQQLAGAGAQQLAGAGAQQLAGAGAQQVVGAGAQQSAAAGQQSAGAQQSLGAGQQQLGSGAQQHEVSQQQDLCLCLNSFFNQPKQLFFFLQQHGVQQGVQHGSGAQQVVGAGQHSAGAQQSAGAGQQVAAGAQHPLCLWWPNKPACAWLVATQQINMAAEIVIHFISEHLLNSANANVSDILVLSSGHINRKAEEFLSPSHTIWVRQFLHSAILVFSCSGNDRWRRISKDRLVMGGLFRLSRPRDERISRTTPPAPTTPSHNPDCGIHPFIPYGPHL